MITVEHVVLVWVVLTSLVIARTFAGLNRPDPPPEPWRPAETPGRSRLHRGQHE